jgi:hypothetical protein
MLMARLQRSPHRFFSIFACSFRFALSSHYGLSLEVHVIQHGVISHKVARIFYQKPPIVVEPDRKQTFFMIKHISSITIKAA